MRKNNGNTLVEAMVAIVILGIIIASVTSIMASANRIERNLEGKMQMTKRIAETYDIFSIDPELYKENLGALDNELGTIYYAPGVFRIYYDARYHVVKKEPTAYFLELRCEYDESTKIYSLEVMCYNNNKLYTFGTVDNFVRRIMVGE